jgi:hypothetical protein
MHDHLLVFAEWLGPADFDSRVPPTSQETNRVGREAS